MFAGSILDTVGDTPLLELDGIHAKLETTNPTGSVKDRLARYLVERAEERGELERGDTIVEVTSGNTGISLAMIAAVKGYRFKAMMPRSMSPERRKMIQMFGGDVILTPAQEGMKGAVERYEAYAAASDDDVWLPRQFDNPDNIAAHRHGIGREVAREMQHVDAVVAGVGTGGTLLGMAQALPDEVYIVAVEPTESAVLSGGPAERHAIQGIGEGFVPSLVEDNWGLIDDVVTIKSTDALKMQRRLARRHGLLVGPSSGANVLAAWQIAKRYESVVTVLPDRGERYINGASR